MGRIMWSLALSGLGIGVGSAPAHAGFPITVDEVCPVGGEVFEHVTTGSYSVFGRFPDGMPHGSWTFPLELPRCPGNDLVVFAEFDKAQIEALAGIIATPEYRQLAADETNYYLAHWLAGRLDMPVEDEIGLMMQATWQTGGEGPRRQRYLEEFVALYDRLLPDPHPVEHGGFTLSVANAERELGRFDAALARLDALDSALPDTRPMQASARRLLARKWRSRAATTVMRPWIWSTDGWRGNFASTTRD